MLDLKGLVEYVKKNRVQLELSQKQLALKSIVSQSLISKLESGILDPSYTTAYKILSTLEELNKGRLKTAKDIKSKPISSVKRSSNIEDVKKRMKLVSISFEYLLGICLDFFIRVFRLSSLLVFSHVKTITSAGFIDSGVTLDLDNNSNPTLRGYGVFGK